MAMRRSCPRNKGITLADRAPHAVRQLLLPSAGGWRALCFLDSSCAQGCSGGKGRERGNKKRGRRKQLHRVTRIFGH